MKGFWREFKSFAVKGNMLDLAIAVVVGNAFTAVVNSLVSDIITPVLGLLTNNIDFKTLAVTLRGNDVLHYGNFFQTIINFLVISLSIFLIFKLVSTTRKRLFRDREETPPAQKSDEVLLLEEIRDLLKEKKGV